MSIKNSNLPGQLASWNQRGVVSKMKNALHTEKMAVFGPGMPALYSGQQCVVISAVSAGERIIRLIDGRQVAVSVADLEPIAREFKGTEGAEIR